MRDGSAHEAEVDGVGAGEGNRLDGLGDQPAADRRAVGGEHQPVAAFQDLDLLPMLSGGPAVVGLGDHVEDRLAGRVDVEHLWPGRAYAMADAQIDGEPAGDHRQMS